MTINDQITKRFESKPDKVDELAKAVASFGEPEDVITRRNREEDDGAAMACNDHDGLS